jgi:hypothetical protein
MDAVLPHINNSTFNQLPTHRSYTGEIVITYLTEKDSANSLARTPTPAPAHTESFRQSSAAQSGLSHGFCPFGFTGSLPAATQSSNLSISLMRLTVSLLISLSPESPCFSPGLSPSLWLGRERKSKNRRRK